MRRIGTAGVVCAYGPCGPVRPECSTCDNRPMRVYQGAGAGQRNMDRCARDGVGIMLCSQWRDVSKFPYYSVDNGAFSAWKHGVKLDLATFNHVLERSGTAPYPPDFVVCPDRVLEGLKSLEYSLACLKELPEGLRYYLAVQDGMTKGDVERHIHRFAGLFVGGSMSWKVRASEAWVALAHSWGKFCHIGRVGPIARIVWAARIGADSIDSTTWVQQDRWHHIEGAKRQGLLEL